jgi:serine/threonine-protein kinase
MAERDDETRLQPDGPAVSSKSAPSSSSGGAVTSSTGWLSSGSEIDHGRFPPGTLLGGRYRIIGRLGRGGMGEVYRADDLKLGQQVALKFLPPELDRDPARLMQLHNEVRMARQVSHPNVCRVYDIDEVDGHTFLSMEFVDGDELASLLRQLGRFAPDRAVEIARQICSGLAAAHERGVVHRDLKPANVMIDDAGKVRITDFGLAGLAGESLRAGTPAYMAPEQIAGEQVTPQSDIYALGLVLYEVFTGRRAFEARNVAELLRLREAGVVPASQLVRDLDPAVDRAIGRCLERDPVDRPASALGVAAALPGGDPLAAALAAGETPSPEMVAASGSTGALQPLPALSALAFTLGSLLAFAAIADRALLTSNVPLEKPLDVLADRAREISRALGYTDAPADTAVGFMPSDDYIRYARERGDGASTRARLRTGDPPGLRFWQRSSPRDMVPIGSDDRVSMGNPPLTVTGMTLVKIDSQGRLVEFHAVPPEREETAPSTPVRADWAALFRLAGLNQTDFQPASPQWTPRGHSDERAAWEGPLPGWSDQRLRLEAAAYRGRPVFFQKVYPWTEPARMTDAPDSRSQRIARTIIGSAVILVVAIASLVARHNLRKGRGDRRGARRIAFVLFGSAMFAWVVGATHFSDVNVEVGRCFTAVGQALWAGGMLWVLYLALEPYVRKFWPKTLVSWSRLLAGNYFDPQVGRDVLLGTLFGVLLPLLGRLDWELRPLLGFPTLPPLIPSVIWLEGTRQMLATVANLVFSAMFNSLWIVFGLVAINLVARRVWITAIVMTAFLMLTTVGGLVQAPPVWFGAIFALAIVSGMVFLILRFGLLATVVLFLVNFVLSSSVLTLDTSKWFFSTSATLLLMVAALAVYGFYASRGGEPVLGRRILE